MLGLQATRAPQDSMSQSTRLGLTFASLIEVFLQVVTVQLGAAEDEGHIHVVLLNGADDVFSLENFHSLRIRFCNRQSHKILIFYAAKVIKRRMHK